MFGKGAQSTPTSAPESGDGASEHASTSAGDKISLDDVIAKLRAADNEDKRAQEILAAATTLRDCSGRARKDALRKMANAWGVTLNEKVGAKYTPRLGSALAEDIQASVCKAALDWESGAARHAVVEESSQSSNARPSSREDEGAAVKKQKPLVLQSTVRPSQHIPGALSTSCPRHLMMSCQCAAWVQTCSSVH